MTRRTLLSVTVNGRRQDAEVESRKSLVDFLREDLRLTGTHVGCEHGVCGACTILLDGEAIRSCIMFAVQAHGRQITTVEGLGDCESLSPIQAAFERNAALQCGFCTPGFLVTAMAYLSELTHVPNEQEVREAISGQVCRCTGYSGIVQAIIEVAQEQARSS